MIGSLAPLLRHAPPEAIDRVARIVEPHRRLWLTASTQSDAGHSGYTLGLLALGRSDLDAAVADLGEAHAAHEAAGEVPMRVRIGLALVEALVERDAAGDRDRALGLTDEVAATCERHGIALLAERAAALVD
jgi:hypothetical protein